MEIETQFTVSQLVKLFISNESLISDLLVVNFDAYEMVYYEI